MIPQVEVTLALPEAWFPLPAGEVTDGEIVEWANSTAYRAWRLRADAGVPEEAVPPGAGERLVVELAGLAANVRDQVGLGDGDYAAVWLPAPELGVVHAVVIVQSAARSQERSPERFADVLLEMTEKSVSGHAPLHVQRLEGEIPAGAVRGLHSLIGISQTELGTAALEERAWFGVFPPDMADYMVEVLFIAERPASFEDMPTETLAILANLEVRIEAGT